MAETLVSRFFAHADRLGARLLYQYPATGGGADGPRWVPVGWRTAAELVRDFGSGLIELGHQKGNALAIVSATRREWLMCDLANLAVGGITVGVYPSMTVEQTRYVVAHCEARIAVVEDAKQLAKVEAARAQLPRLEHVVVIDATGVKTGPAVLTLDEVLARGRAARHDVDARAHELTLADAAIFVYTSGTTGPPKGAMLTHGNLVAAMRSMGGVEVDAQDAGFSFLPLAHVLQRAVDYRGVWEAVPGSYGRSLETVADDLASARPTVMAAVPRIFEKIYAKIHEQASAGSPTKKKIFAWALGVGRRVSKLRQAQQPVPALLGLQHKLARLLVFDKLRARLGGRVRVFFTGGAPISPEILEFFHAADIMILEAWGMTETFAAGSANIPGAFRFGSIGKPLPGIDMKLDEDGEILVRGANVFAGYYKDDDATKQSFTADGFFRTGDIGKVDADGFFYIIDRKKDLLITAAGKNIAPQNLENLIKTDPRISQVVAVGDRRPYVVALVTLTAEAAAGKSDAEQRRLVEDIIGAKNPELAPYERIKKFRILPSDLTQESGELTPTLKVKRKVVAEKYGAMIEEMYKEGRPAEAEKPA
jgi:long-chain acyl-CoA synthetase